MISLYDAIYRAIILCGSLTGLLFFQRLTPAFRVLAFFLLYTFLSESASLYMAYTHHFNYTVFSVYLPAHIAFWGGIYYLLFTVRRIKQIAGGMSLVLLIISVIYILSLPETKMPILMIDLESLLLIVFSIMYFYFLVKYPIEDNILLVPGFWLSSSVLIYNSGSFIYMASFNFLTNTGITKITLNNIHNGMNIFHYGILWYSMYLQVKRGKHAKPT